MLHISSEIVASMETVLVLIGLDAVLGMLLALKRGTWDWHKVAHFMEASVLPYAGGLTVLAAGALLVQDLKAAYLAAAAATVAKLVADVTAKVKHLNVSTGDSAGLYGKTWQES